ADALISMAAEITRSFGDMVLRGVLQRANLEAIVYEIGQHVAGRYGLELDRADLEMTVSGYIFYFLKKGLARS
ncbi:MAG: hypothetical protein V3S51_02505, partial [Dehalococcoidia bacterium]